jgi:5-exo-hydroxycamphor dehydrogenase
MTPPKAVIAFGCAMPTALRGFAKLGPVSSGTDIVIQGSGPVGLACTMLANMSGARSITVIGDPEHRLQAARFLGATNLVSLATSTIKQRAEMISRVTKGRQADIVIEAAGAPAAFSEGFHLLGMNGKYLILGLYSGQAACTVDPVRINNLNLQIIGSLGIEPVHYHETVRIASNYNQDFNLADLVTHSFPLECLGQAIDTVRQGIAIKAVVVP